MNKVYVLRGSSGSGKSFWIKHNVVDPIICSADNFFMKEGKYQFDPKQLGQAHGKCFKDFINALMVFKDNPEATIVVDNTSIDNWEISPYVLAATAFGWPWEIIYVKADLEKAIIGNQHGVPEKKVREMFERLDKIKLRYPQTEVNGNV